MPSFLVRIGGQVAVLRRIHHGKRSPWSPASVAPSPEASSPSAGHARTPCLYLVPAISAALAVPPALRLFLRPPSFTLPSLAVAIFLIFLGTGPVNAATVNAVRPEIRATALAGQLLIIHALGDAISPRIIGAVSDRSTLNLGLGSTLVTLVLASIIFFIGSGFAPPLHSLEPQAAS